MFEQCVSMGDRYVGTAQRTRLAHGIHWAYFGLVTCCYRRTLLGIAYSEQAAGSRVIIILDIQIVQQRFRIRVLGGKSLRRFKESENQLISYYIIFD